MTSKEGQKFTFPNAHSSCFFLCRDRTAANNKMQVAQVLPTSRTIHQQTYSRLKKQNKRGQSCQIIA